ncbi:MAG: cation:proton antiporter [Candidatus Rokubacteria bacterium]|nr:cation:proton antiporter [Candidatus Rokubacteria bacterium]
MDHPIFYRDLAYVFAAAVIGGGAAWLMRQPLVLGYVVGGVLISPLTPGPAVSDIRTFELFAEVGVILLMFSIGIEFSVRDLVRVKWVALVGGPLGILLSIALGAGVGHVLGWPVLQSVVIGMVVSVASTMVLARLLLDRGELHSRHGRIIIGISLVEDLAVVVLIILMPRLGALTPERLATVAGGLGLAAAILVPFFYLAAKVVPRLLARVAHTRNQELFLLVALAIALGAAAVTQAAGLSLALGAFLAGLLISESDYAHETLARLLPLRDAFVALFFVTMGALLNPAAVIAHPATLVAMVGLVVVGKLVIRSGVVRLFGYPPRTALLVGLGLSQIGEFSFVLVQVARSAGHVSDDIYQATLAVSLVSILINAALVRRVPRWLGRLRIERDRDAVPPVPAPAPLTGHVVICSFGRVGSAVGEAFETFGIRYVAIEVDPEIVRGLRARGVPCLFGDAADRDVLEEAGVRRASLVVVAVPEIDAAERVIHRVHALNPAVRVMARANEPGGRDRLMDAGASAVIEPEFEAASTLIRQALRSLDLPRERVLAYLTRFREAMDALPASELPSEKALPELREVGVDRGGLADMSLRDARVRERFGVTVVAITRPDGDVILQPSADAVVHEGDRVLVFGLPEQHVAFVRALHSNA